MNKPTIKELERHNVELREAVENAKETLRPYHEAWIEPCDCCDHGHDYLDCECFSHRSYETTPTEAYKIIEKVLTSVPDSGKVVVMNDELLAFCKFTGDLIYCVIHGKPKTFINIPEIEKIIQKLKEATVGK